MTTKSVDNVQYDNDGFERMPQALDEAAAAALSRRIQQLFDSQHEVGTPADDRPVIQIWRHQEDGQPSFVAIEQIEGLDRLLRDDGLLSRFADLVGADYLQLFEAVAIVKPPGAGEGFVWHTDASFFPFDPNCYATLWIALTPCNAETGGMSMARGSHRTGPWASVNVKTGERLVARSTVALPPRNPESVGCLSVRTDLNPGDAVIFHANTLHRSNPNVSETTYRQGLVLRFVTRATPVIKTDETRAKFVGHVQVDKNGYLISTPRMPIIWRRTTSKRIA